MQYEARLVAVDDSIEEEVTVRIGDVELCCFANRGHPGDLDRIYQVELSLQDVGGWRLEALGDVDLEPRITRVGSGYGYVLVGRLDGLRLDAGVLFVDACFADYAYLSGTRVRVHVDRIGIDFLDDTAR